MKTTTLTPKQTLTLDQAGTTIANAALRLVAASPKAKGLANKPATLDLVIAAMKAATPGILDQLFLDLKAAPTVANYATQAAVLAMAQAGLAQL